MALSQRKRTIAVAVDADTGRLLDIAARERGISRAEFIRRQLRRGLEQFRHHPRPRSAGVITSVLRDRGDETELFRDIER
jgi:metal-responsive CopG/Arc/MetJ family transcriptional regulator